MEQIGNPKISSFILHFYRHLLNGNNESVEKIGTDDYIWELSDLVKKISLIFAIQQFLH